MDTSVAKQPVGQINRMRIVARCAASNGSMVQILKPPKLQRRFSSDLAQAARSPGAAVPAAHCASHASDHAHAGTEPDPTKSATAAATATTEATATTAANKSDPAAATAEAAATSAATTASTAATASASTGQLQTAADVFPIENIKRGEADVGHFLFAKNEALIGRVIVGLRDVRSGDRRCRCITHQRKT